MFGLFKAIPKNHEDNRRGQRLTSTTYKTLTGAMAGKRALRRELPHVRVGIWRIPNA